MYPQFFGIFDSYTIMMILGIAFAILFAVFYMKNKYSRNTIIDLVITSLCAIIGGIVFSILFENLFEFIKYGKEYKFKFAMTFMGGLFGGVLTFLFVYFLFYKKNNPGIMKDLLCFAPICITGAHGLGRIGCFLAGCCYGIPTDKWYGIDFPNVGKVIPTNLFEAIFLLLLCALLIFLLLRIKFIFTLPLYLFLYGLFRFLIEFLRGDERGEFILNFISPSQGWSILMILLAIPVVFLVNKLNKNE